MKTPKRPQPPAAMTFRMRGADTAMLMETGLSRIQRMLLEALEALPDGELLEAATLAAMIGRQVATMRQHTASPLFAGFRDPHPRKANAHVWGNPKTIAALRKLRQSNHAAR